MIQLFDTAITAALEAGKAILEIYHSGEFDVEIKGDNSPLTKADTSSHNLIMSYLETTGIPVLSEEGRDIPFKERKDWKQLWIVDPIDGTKEFIKRNGEFTINIALIENQKPLIGVIFVPVTGDLYFSTKNSGAFKVIVDLGNFDIETLISNVNESLSIQLITHYEYQQKAIFLELQIYRIIQEFLSNVIKHANATDMCIHIRDTRKALAIILSDNGVGFDKEKLQNGMGLQNIDSRIQSIHALSKWKSKKGKGSRLIIKTPIQ